MVRKTSAKLNMNITVELEQKLIKYYLAPHTLKDTTFVVLGQKCTKLASAILKKYGIKKHDKSVLLKLNAQACLAKYGTTNPSSSNIVREKVKATVKAKYGVDNVFQANTVKNKIKVTCLSKYGAEHYNKTEESKQRHKQTCLAHLGVEAPMQCEYIKEKYKNTCLNKYGVDNYTKTDQYKQTCAEKSKQTMEKQKQTKQKHKTFNVSAAEREYLKQLELKYGAEDIITQYIDSRYPYACDFYIKSIDTFIELNLTWTHGGKLFEGTEEDIQKLIIWKEKAKTSKYYQNAIYTWTDLDTRKNKTAKERGLNYIVFYSKEELKVI